jgi:hypothetical protein
VLPKEDRTESGTAKDKAASQALAGPLDSSADPDVDCCMIMQRAFWYFYFAPAGAARRPSGSGTSVR